MGVNIDGIKGLPPYPDMEVKDGVIRVMIDGITIFIWYKNPCVIFHDTRLMTDHSVFGFRKKGKHSKYSVYEGIGGFPPGIVSWVFHDETSILDVWLPSGRNIQIDPVALFEE